MRAVAGLGDANDIRTWSGIPYHFLMAGKEAGVFDHGLRLQVADPLTRAKRILWNAKRALSNREFGGYQYTVEFLADLWRDERARLADAVVVNTFQMYPPSLVEDDRTKKWFFIDQTLTQLMSDSPGHMSCATRREIFARERAGYLAAEGVIAHSQWAAGSLRRDYGVPPARLHVAVPGANILAPEYRSWEERHIPDFDSPSVLRILFLGRDWRRKGLDRLLLGFDLARARGLRAAMTVAGIAPQTLPRNLAAIGNVTWAGLLDKRANYPGFLDTVSSYHLGATLSFWEPGGIATREFHALGVPTLVTDVCGAVEHQVPGAGIVLPAHSGPEDVAVALLKVPDQLGRLRRTAWDLRRQALYAATFDAILPVWPHAR